MPPQIAFAFGKELLSGQPGYFADFAISDTRSFKVSRASFLIIPALLLAIASGYAATQHKRLPTEELEKYEDPPMFIFRLGTSAAMVSQFGAFTSVQVNVDANGHNITGDAANEPSLSVDPTNHSKMAIGWRQFDSVFSNFREAGRAYTTNAGASWTFPGVLENNVFRSDPVLASDSVGRFFYLSLLQNFLTTSGVRSISGFLDAHRARNRRRQAMVHDR